MKNNKNKRNTIIWLMTWAVLFLVVAYSPIGRPDLYVGTSYYISNQGVNFKEGIANAPKGTAYATDEDESNMLDYTPTTDNNVDNSGNVSEYSPQNTSNGTVNYSRASGSNQSSGQSGSIILADNSSKGSAQGTATAQSNDVSSLSSNLTLTSSTSANRQTAPRSPNDRYDPGGGKKKPHDSIPVGDGVWLLLVLVGFYSLWKKHQATKASSTTHK